MSESDLALLAHLLRRAGFGTTRDELEEYATKDYAAVVEDLLHPERFPEVEEDVVCRYYSLGTIREDSPEVFVLVVNGDYPAGASRSTMPGNVLKILPPLPSVLEYRIVDSHLILMDAGANIVVDYVLDVMCKTC